VCVEAEYLVSTEVAGRKPARRSGARAWQGVASRRHGARHVADRQDRSDRQQAGSAGPLHQCSIRRVSRQLLSHEESIMRPILLFVVAVALIAPAVLRASDPGT